MKRALIVGISGQDGGFLAELLRDKGYAVFGLAHGDASARMDAARRALPFVRLIPGDLRSTRSLVDAVEAAEPDEVYNLGAVSSVAVSWSQPEEAAEIGALGALRLLEAIRTAGGEGSTRVYQASSSEMFGSATDSPQNEETPFAPAHPYAIAKVFAHQTAVSFREAYGMYTACGILFNHESPRRLERFVTRKISRGVARIALGRQDHLMLGNMDARRDWGYAPEYVEAMWLMLQQPSPADFVVATGVTHSVREFVEAAFGHVGITDWERFVVADPNLMRPADIAELKGDASKAAEALGWRPRTSFEDLVRLMVDADVELAGSEADGEKRPAPPTA